MTLLNIFKPDWMVKSIYNIQPEELKALGFKAVLADLDNTLVAWNVKESTLDAIDWIGNLQTAGLPVVVISNNFPSRVRPVADALNVDYIGNSLKPTTRAYRKALKLLDEEKENVVMVGDQLMTDILGANIFGMQSILVKPLINTDAGYTLVNRKMERWVMKQLQEVDDQLDWKESLSEHID